MAEKYIASFFNRAFYSSFLLSLGLWLLSLKLKAESVFCPLKSQNKGQVIVEYMLLLVVSTAMALVFVKLVSLTQGGVVFDYWKHILKVIGEDIST